MHLPFTAFNTPDVAFFTSVRPIIVQATILPNTCSIRQGLLDILLTYYFNYLSHTALSILGLHCQSKGTDKLEEQHLMFHLGNIQPNSVNIDLSNFPPSLSCAAPAVHTLFWLLHPLTPKSLPLAFHFTPLLLSAIHLLSLSSYLPVKSPMPPSTYHQSGFAPLLPFPSVPSTINLKKDRNWKHHLSRSSKDAPDLPSYFWNCKRAICLDTTSSSSFIYQCGVLNVVRLLSLHISPQACPHHVFPGMLFHVTHTPKQINKTNQKLQRP